MTKAEFYAEVTSISDLIDFCCTYGFEEVVDGIRSSDDFDDWVWDSLEECRSGSYWYEIKGWLEDLVSPDTEWVRITGFLRYENLYHEDLEYWMDKVIDAGDECDFWEPEDDEWLEDDEPEESEDVEEPVFEAGFVLTQLIGVA